MLACSALQAAPTSDSAVEQQFTHLVRPFIAQYCAPCHSGASPAAQFDLKAYTTVDMVAQDYGRWARVLEKLSRQQMPPKGMPQPAEEGRQAIVAWIETMRLNEERKHAGDPGPVLARRLSNAEYNYTIRDLTGVDMRPAREFPVDPANPAGFDNSGESLTMSPTLLKKYLEAAREVADHVVLTPDGIAFAPYPMLVETDREKYAIQRIVSFYGQQPTDYADYFQAAWRYKYRRALGRSRATLARMAAEAKVSPKYLNMIWPLIEEPAEAARQEVGPIARLQAMWRALPGAGADPQDLRAKCAEMRDWVVRIRHDTAMQFAAPVVEGLPPASQPLLDWKLREFASHRRDWDPTALRNDTDPPLAVPEIPNYPGLHKEAAPRWAALMQKARAGDPDLVVPAAERARYEASFTRFASVFPDAFYIKERGRYFPDDSEDPGRLLSASYHNVMGYFRDDTPLQELILDENGKRELEHLWDEFDFIADFTARTWIQYYDNESGEVEGKGAESGSPRPSDRTVTDPAIIFGLRDAYVAKAKADPDNDPVAVEAILDHFQRVNDTIRRMERMRREAEPRHLDALLNFTARAYRRPLSHSERDVILEYYHTLLDKDRMTHEQAIRESIAAALMSPDFCFRLDLLDAGAARVGSAKARVRTIAAKSQAGVTGRPLSEYSLASRLSYSLWSSMPDQQLLDHAAAGDLRKREVLLEQVSRMLKDERARGFVTEFAGNWLDFRRFEDYTGVDRERFPNFDSRLRTAMFEEPIRFIQDLIQNNRSLLDLLYGNYTFVNPVLARHYGIPEAAGGDDRWVRVDDANRYNRGGLLGMSVFLTENSPGLRTSPVKRGYWLVHRVLGETIPPPPAVVPELPSDESKSELPIRDMLAAHRHNPLCASCHARFDGFGLAFEGYGPIGEVRTKDLAGRPVDMRAEFPNGSAVSGLEGVQRYIRERRQRDFLDSFTRKLLSYALSRSLQLADEPLIQQMETRLAANSYRFPVLVETLVTSPQFLNRRNTDLIEKPDLQKKGD
jgi:Protein of unknown function (DUF1592)/Protein of unknown function (DUF1588)/Protein of unknown function (DUF1587)/Protein of unknown function (DUF1585)/Protein of unknown function (DUF1595)